MQLMPLQDRLIYRQEHCESYLVYTLEQDNLILHQYKMLSHNAVLGIVSLTQFKYDTLWEIRFNITGLVSLEVFLARKQPTRAIMANCLIQILDTIDNCRHYLLDRERFILNMTHAYIDLNTMCISLLYFPLAIETGSSNQELNAFLQDLLYAYKGDLTTEFSIFCNQINHQLRTPNLSIKELKQAIEVLISSELSAQTAVEEQINFERDAVNTPMKPYSTDSPVKQIRSKTFRDEIMTSSAVIKEGMEKKTKISPKVLLVVMNIIFLGALVTNWESFVGFTGSSVNALLSVFFLGLPLNYFMYKGLNRDKASQFANTFPHLMSEPRQLLKNKKKALKGPPLNVQVQDKQICGPSERLIQEVKAKPLQITISEPSKKQWVEEANGIRAVESPTHPTELLKKRPSGQARLVDREKALDFLLKTNRFIIGRQADLTDLTLSDATVGRIHAEIKCVDQCYIIVDLNSKNGTFINGIRLTCNMPYPLKSGDCIQFSKKAFHFEID